MRACWSVGIAVALLASPAASEPQANASLTVGGAAVGPDGTFWDHAEFHLGARADVMFLREQPWDFGLGPYLELSSYAFDQLQIGGGGSVHLPVHEALPLVLSAGGHARLAGDDLGVAPGVGGTLFWGSRSYDYHDNYVMAGGLLLGVRHSFGRRSVPSETMFTVTAQIDFALLAVPFIALAGVLAGPSHEAREIE